MRSVYLEHREIDPVIDFKPGGTGAVMVALGVAHPPAGATTLIISLGLMAHPWQMPILMGAVVVMILQGLVINRLAGIDYPLWRLEKS